LRKENIQQLNLLFNLTRLSGDETEFFKFSCVRTSLDYFILVLLGVLLGMVIDDIREIRRIGYDSNLE